MLFRTRGPPKRTYIYVYLHIFIYRELEDHSIVLLKIIDTSHPQFDLIPCFHHIQRGCALRMERFTQVLEDDLEDLEELERSLKANGDVVWFPGLLKRSNRCVEKKSTLQKIWEKRSPLLSGDARERGASEGH